MPIYEYQCDGCSEVFEVFQKHSDPPPTEHSCGSTQVHRILSNTSFQLKGTGWYITDYGRKGSGDDSGAGKAGKKSDKGEGGGSDKSDSSGSSSDSKTSDSSSSAPASSPSPTPPKSGGGNGGGSGSGGGGAAAA